MNPKPQVCIFLTLEVPPALTETLFSFTINTLVVVCTERGEDFYSCFISCVNAAFSVSHIKLPKTSSCFKAELLCAEGHERNGREALYIARHREKIPGARSSEPRNLMS